MTHPLSVAVAGLGTVGSGVLKLLRDNADVVTARAGRPIAVTAVSARDRTRDRDFVARAASLLVDRDFGLVGTVWTEDTERGLDIARQIETGTIGINGYFPAIDAPYGGTKASGMGRENGPEGMAAYQQFQSIYRL